MTPHFSLRPLLLTTCLALAGNAIADEAQLRAEINELRAELAGLRAEIHANKPAVVAPAVSSAASKSTPAASHPPATPVNTAPIMGNTEGTRFFGYGEINYNRPTNNSAAAQADLRRAVLGFEHRFDENTKAVAEFEWEHAVASADDRGESEVEQLYVERQLTPNLSAKAGLFLIPLGLLNESHEPTFYYGVERNVVETAIIPSTWREGGVSLIGNTDSGLNWQVGLTTNFDINKWDAQSSEGRESPLGSIHQEMQLAKAHDPAFFASLNYRGTLGLTAGGGVFTGKIGQGQQDSPAKNSRLTLWELHSRWQSGPWDLSALYAKGTISNTADLNLTFAGNPTPVPKSFWGGYLQGAYKVNLPGNWTLSPFVRHEWVNTAASYEAMPAGLGVAASDTEQITSLGANLMPNSGVVLKADYQRFKLDSSLNRVNLGLGFQF